MKAILLTLTTFIMLSTTLSAQEESYYFSKTIKSNFEDTYDKVRTSLENNKFGIITEIEMHEKLNEKLDVDVKPYRIIGACNPGFAYETMQVEDNIGLFLPCKVLVKYIDENTTEVVMVNPSVLMKMLNNEALIKTADQVTELFKKAIDEIE